MIETNPNLNITLYNVIPPFLNNSASVTSDRFSLAVAFSTMKTTTLLLYTTSQNNHLFRCQQ